MCPEVLDIIRRWHFSKKISDDNADILTRQGKLELFFLAHRLQNSFPELLTVDSTHVNREDFVVKSKNLIFLIHIFKLSSMSLIKIDICMMIKNNC